MTARLIRLTRITVAIICAMVLVGGGTTAAIAATSASTTGTITGTISDPGGYPLAGIKVKLFKDGADEGTYVGTATTNDAGRYRFTGVQAKAGDPFWFGATDSSGAHVYAYSAFNVGSGTVTTKNRTMPIAGFIQGKVSTKDGTAAAKPGTHVYVTAYGTDTVASAQVSARGTFRIGGLPAGSYVVELIDGGNLFAAQCYNNVKMSKEGCEGTKSATYIKVIAGKAVTIAPQVMNRPINR